MCECLSYEDGSEYLCEACGPRWREYEASLSTPPADAATEAVARARRLEEFVRSMAQSECALYVTIDCEEAGRDESDWCWPCRAAALSTPAPAPSAKEGRT